MLLNQSHPVSERQLSLFSAFTAWWRRQREQVGILAALYRLSTTGYEFLRDSLPAQRRRRYGDIDFDWEHRVNTTAATVTWRSRLLGMLNSAYQPIPPEQFREIMTELANHLGGDKELSRFTFIDIGSGKGRALLLASQCGFRRIIGVELLPELDQVARENIQRFEQHGGTSSIELIRGDATTFCLPLEPMVIFLFNPLPEAALRAFLEKTERFLREFPRPTFVIYANPIFARTFSDFRSLQMLGGTHQSLLFRSSGG
jgi:SAM-dependent methyltransferase